ncbi:MAG: hemolysin family protein [Clostridia bacterium]|nr:hemolysin family protein [Clostridia bacterium]MDO5302574.1 hemolysin family protein [Clostridia bacterium]
MYYFIIVISIILNGVIIVSNTAMNSVNKNKIKQLAEEGNKSAIALQDLLDKAMVYRFTNRFLSYTFFAVGLYGALNLPFDLPYYNAIAIAAYIALILSFSEYFTRKLAEQHSEGIALTFAGIEKFLVIVLKPIVLIPSLIANLFLVIFHQKTNVEDNEYSEDKVMSMLEAGQQSGEIKEEGKKMINSIFSFDDKLAYEIMTPRTDVFVIDIKDSPDEYLDQLMELRYSRIPVCEDETDNIIGILHIKDYLIKARESGFDKVDILAILRKPYFVPETKNIDSLFFELQKEKQQVAILIDEYGGFSGIVTMEDIVEEIVGDIDDEYDEEDHVIQKIDDNNYIVDGDVYLSDISEEAKINLESDSSETIGGFIIDILGEIPEDGDEDRELKFQNYIFTILSVKDRRIEKVKIEILPEDVESDSEDNDIDIE